MNKFLKKVAKVCKIQEDHPVFKILEVCGYDSYTAIISLKSADMKDIQTYCSNQKIDFKPGFYFTLQDIGKKVEIAGEESFTRDCDDEFGSVNRMAMFPLLMALFGQVGIRIFAPIVKKFSIYMRLVLGPIYYVFLSLNLPLMKLQTVQEEIGKEQIMVEGQLMVEALIKHLKEFNVPTEKWIVFIGEDGTRLIDKAELDQRTNLLVGFVSPLEPGTGLPKLKFFPAESPAKIAEYFKKHQLAKILYAMVAVPLVPEVPPFVLTVFGTDNQFEYTDVLERFAYIKDQLNAAGVHVVGYGADADSRLLKAMKISMNLGQPAKLKYIFANLKPQQINFQDYMHILTKLKAKLNDSAFPLKIGDYKISISTLKALIKDNTSLRKYLSPSDLRSDDRMNVDCARKFYHPEVMKHVTDLGLRFYLTLMRDIMCAFEDKSLSIRDRIVKAWFVVFCLRAWRHSIKSNPSRKLKDNFITTPTYQAIEINCHSLIAFYMFCRDSKRLWLFNSLGLTNSQSCEELFRKLRSMTTLYWTWVNMTIREALYKIRRVNILYALEQFFKNNLKFHKDRSSKFYEAPLEEYNDEEIIGFLETAKDLAKSFLLEVNVNASDEFFDMRYTMKTDKSAKKGKKKNYNDSESETDEEEVCDEVMAESFIGADCDVVQKYCGEYVDVCHSDEENDNRFFYTTNNLNKKIKIRKEAFINLFADPDKVSKDRDRRFRYQNIMHFTDDTNITEVKALEELHEFDFITLHKFTGVARVLAFRYSNIKKKKESRMKQTVIKVKDSKIEMSLQYFKISADGELIAASVAEIDDQLFITVKQYKAHVPVISNSGKTFINCKIERLFSYKDINLDEVFLAGFPALKQIEKQKESKSNKRTHKMMIDDPSTSTRKRIKLEKTKTKELEENQIKGKIKTTKSKILKPKVVTKKNVEKQQSAESVPLNVVPMVTAKIKPPNKKK